MLRILFALTLALGLQARTCFAQAPIDTVHIRLVTQAKLPEGILAVTLCAKDGLPVVFARDAEPDPSTLLHEGIHVAQIARFGGCPKGWDYMTRDAHTLLAMEAEAYCGEAYWRYYHQGREVRKTLAEALRALRELSIVRATVRPEWELSLGEIAHAIQKACPDFGPTYPPGTTITGITGNEAGAPHFVARTRADGTSVAKNPLTN